MFLELEQVAGKFRQLAGSIHGRRIHGVRRQHFRVAMLARVQVEHEVRESPLQLRSQIPIHSKSRARELGGALQIKNAKLLAQFPMWFWLKAELWRIAPTPYF